MLYLDYAATTPIHDQVLDLITTTMKAYYGNPSSLHRIGMEAEQVVNQARTSCAASLHCNPQNIIFTSGGTESNNLAIKGAVFARKNRGKHIITSPIEHPSVYECFAQLAKQGFRVTYIPVDSSGVFRLEDVENAIESDTILVSLMHVNNEMGRIQPIEAIGSFLRQHSKITFHVDATQSIGKLPVIPQELGADLVTISAHKFGGPKGAGILYRRTGLELRPELAGGGQEFGLRSGTENVAFIAGMALALQIAINQQAQNREKLNLLRDRLLSGMSKMDAISISGAEDPSLMAPQLLHFCFPGMKSEVVIHALEQYGICISTRSACTSGKSQASRILLAMGMNQERAASGLRVSYSSNQTVEEMDYFVDRLQQVVLDLQGPMQAYARSVQNKRRR